MCWNFGVKKIARSKGEPFPSQLVPQPFLLNDAYKWNGCSFPHASASEQALPDFKPTAQPEG